MSVYELAQMYYPRLWDKSRIKELVKAGRLSEAEAVQITGGNTSTQGQGGNGHESE